MYHNFIITKILKPDEAHCVDILCSVLCTPQLGGSAHVTPLSVFAAVLASKLQKNGRANIWIFASLAIIELAAAGLGGRDSAGPGRDGGRWKMRKMKYERCVLEPISRVSDCAKPRPEMLI